MKLKATAKEAVAEPDGPDVSLFKISTISELTGFLPTLLRAWERRYKFLEPQRMPGGHRLYTHDDLRVLRKIRDLMDRGLSVGEIANQGRERLLQGPVDLKPSEDWMARARQVAPEDLQVFRLTRYRGENLDASLRDLSAEDLTTVVLLYSCLKKVYELWRYMDREAKNEELLWEQLYELRERDLPTRIAKLGALRSDYGKMVLAALEDTRWGALEPLFAHLRPDLERDRENLERAVLLCRDQAKMMRNAFYDLDSSLRSADEADKAHSVRSLVDKLQGGTLNLDARLEFEGAISSRCLETSALDRVVYDMLRRLDQVRPSRTRLWVGPVGETLIRWAFHFDGEGFRPHQEDDLATVAVGMSVGLSGKAALQQSYIGSSEGWAWFHWPFYPIAPGVSLCECELD